ncbi:pyruvate kinase [Thecamonas trahens ATCC 50062]|uniref:Pyruvate kinase n=1 Tax=Thecamonas trahens ATCC 50062 TaxID=461836 RepID=A0A0L0DG21_THETB|nr:pyruvate kinase [Thecamonas trahens ATCC 50062]KNC51269.1 pyruvate kinase [Thecamonas trahens ATCC 50062]|eukprot:XP_013756197.1 pyruvate kinase [Thecamonas trahens ATCC 50062]
MFRTCINIGLRQHAGIVQRSVSSLSKLVDLDVRHPHSRDRKTKVICTVGPATWDASGISSLLDAGMNVMRLNFSHGSYEDKAKAIATLRAELDRNARSDVDFDDGSCEDLCAIAADTKGPEIRTGAVADGAKAVELVGGSTVEITTDPQFATSCTASRLFLDYPDFANEVSEGQTVFVDDGLIELTVTGLHPGEGAVDAKVVNGGMLGSGKGINLPGASLSLPAVSERDAADLAFAVEQDMDIVFGSFIRSAADIADIRTALGPAGAHIMVMAKIENWEGVLNFDEILAASDGIMVARGDLGIEVPASKVFLAQKSMLAKCVLAGKPAIVATQMLESMVKNPRPTRAEVSDVGNAVVDGADAVMLSGETAVGAYPQAAVQIMGKVCQEAEAVIDHGELGASIRGRHAAYEDVLVSVGDHHKDATRDAIASAATDAAARIQSPVIVVLSASGGTARDVARFRPEVPIVAVTDDARVARQLNVSKGVFPVVVAPAPLDAMRASGVAFGKSLGLPSATTPTRRSASM